MGEYGKLYFNNHPVIITEDGPDTPILSLFTIEDLKIYERKYLDKRQDIFSTSDDGDEQERAVEFRSSARVIKDKLEVVGFTLAKAERAFKESIEIKIKHLKDVLVKNSTDNKDIKSEIEILNNTSFQKFQAACKKILDKGYTYKQRNEPYLEDEDGLVRYILNSRDGIKIPYYYGEGYQDQRILLRMLIELTGPETSIIFDLTELYYHLDTDQDILEEFNSLVGSDIPHEYRYGAKTLILTEGSTDVQILKNSLEILYPHLMPYFMFMDFGLANASGSAGSLVTTIKSFVGAGIDNRIIALFDNDTAAEAAMRGLRNTSIPKNIRVLKFPTLEIAKNYPVLGDCGLEVVDINNRACSIELYLGKDVLVKDGVLSPIKWKGYDPGTRQYQGEVLDKDNIQKKFQEKIKICRQVPDKIQNYDWDGIKLILQAIFTAFHEE